MNDKHTFSPGSRMLPQHDNEALHLHLDEQERCNQCWIDSMCDEVLWVTTFRQLGLDGKLRDGEPFSVIRLVRKATL